jgi:hypothetical protein
MSRDESTTSCRRCLVPIYITRSRVLFVRFEVFAAVTMKNAVVWDIVLRGCCKNRRFGGT